MRCPHFKPEHLSLDVMFAVSALLAVGFAAPHGLQHARAGRAGARMLAVGEAAPSFSLPDANGKEVKVGSAGSSGGARAAHVGPV